MDSDVAGSSNPGPDEGQPHPGRGTDDPAAGGVVPEQGSSNPGPAEGEEEHGKGSDNPGPEE